MGKKIKKYYFEVKGSAVQPYAIALTLAPLTISCTCAAAYTNTPCKHRITMLNGNDPGFVDDVPENYIEILQKAKQEAETIGVFSALEAYQQIKAERQELLKESEREFKNYREALISQKGEKAVEKAFAKMNSAILELLPVEVRFEKISSELNTVFVRHNTDVEQLAKTALK
jgi:hypothetical protein